jgi:putative photosynthetic complex assembly protein 2
MPAYLALSVYAILVLGAAVTLPAIADRLSSGVFSWMFGLATVGVVGALVGLALTRDDLSLRGVFVAHLYATVVWVWMEIGCRASASPRGRRLGFARQSPLWQEVMWLAPAAGVVALTWNGANQWGVWTFVLYWWGHLSMRLTAYASAHARDGGPLIWPPWFAAGLPPAQMLSAIFPLSVSVTMAVCVWLGADALTYGLATAQGVGLALMAAQTMVVGAALWLDVLAVDVWFWRLRSSRRLATLREDGWRINSASQ